MKTKIIYLGLFAVGFCTTSIANSESTFQVKEIAQIQTIENRGQMDTIGEKKMEIEIFDPSSIILNMNGTTIEDRIKEDQQITEFIPSPAQYLSLEFSLEDKILEYNQIIESKTSNEYLPLNFDIINQIAIDSKKANQNSLLLNELKL